MTRRRIPLALFALLFAVAVVAAAGPTAPTGAAPQLVQSQTESAVPQVELDVRENAVRLMADPATLLFGAQPQAGCQCKSTSDCPSYCNTACIGAPCGHCAC